MKEYYEIGGLFRKQFRNACLSLGIACEEDWALLNSSFKVEADKKKLRKLEEIVDEWNP